MCLNLTLVQLLLLSLTAAVLEATTGQEEEEDDCDPGRGRFRCGLGDCIDADLVCTGSADCVDGADEGQWCQVRTKRETRPCLGRSRTSSILLCFFQSELEIVHRPFTSANVVTVYLFERGYKKCERLTV